MRALLYFLALTSCCVPPLYVFSEEYITPKWYLGLTAVALTAIYEVWTFTHGTRCVDVRLHALSHAAKGLIVYECGYALYYWLRSGLSNGAGINGTFENPAPMALHLCMLLPIVLWHATGGRRRLHTCLALSVAVAAVTMIFLTQSRAGFISLAIMLCPYVGIVPMRHRRRQADIAAIMITAVAVAVTCAVAWFCVTGKQDSTNGREFILKTTWTLIQEQPIRGHGHGGFHRLYMERQAEFFARNGECAEAWLADDIRHPLNEFLYLWVDYGITAPLILLALLIVPIVCFIKHGNMTMAATMIPILIFSILSYPLQYPLTWLVIGITNMLVVCRYSKSDNRLKEVFRLRTSLYTPIVAVFMYAMSATCIATVVYNWYWDYQWSGTSRKAAHGFSKEMMPRYELLHSHFAGNPYFLYNYMAEQFYAGHFADAAATYAELHRLASTYDMELLMGDICLHDGKPGRSLSHYTRAMYMVPVRFAPLDGQLRAYAMMGDTLRADSVARVIMGKCVKVPSAAVEQIRHEAEKYSLHR